MTSHKDSFEVQRLEVVNTGRRRRGRFLILDAVQPRLCGKCVGGPSVFPVPGQKLVEVPGRMVCDPGQHVGEPGLRIDVVHLGGDDQGVHDRGPVAAAIGAGEQPGLPPERDAAQGPLGGVVGQGVRVPGTVYLTLPLVELSNRYLR